MIDTTSIDHQDTGAISQIEQVLVERQLDALRRLDQHLTRGRVRRHQLCMRQRWWGTTDLDSVEPDQGHQTKRHT